MGTLGWTHTATAVLALLSGAAVLLTRKGTTRHRQLGWLYAASMLAMDGTALTIYRLFGGFGPFHVFAIASLLTVIAGVWAAMRAGGHRRTHAWEARGRTLEQHYAWMTWSYVGLVAAAVSEVATRAPALRPQPGMRLGFGVAVALATIAVVAVGGRLIRRRKAALLAPFQQHAGKASLARAS